MTSTEEEPKFRCRYCGVAFREEPFENCPARWPHSQLPHTDLPDGIRYPVLADPDEIDAYGEFA